MTSVLRAGERRFRKAACILAAVIAVGAAATAGAGPSTPGSAISRSQTKAFKVTVSYVAEFYPLWLSYFQSLYASKNHLIGPDRVTQLYQIVVAINVDTLYASTFLDLTDEPVVLTVPSTGVRYSILTLDPYGDVFDSGLPAQTPGVFALTGPQFTGDLPDGVTRISMPLNHAIIIFRADKYSSAGENQKKDAEIFRKSLLTQTLSNWKQNQSGGATGILPQAFFAVPFKTAADTLVAADPVTFLTQLQAAVHAANTPPLSSKQQELSDKFDKLFAEGKNTYEFGQAVQAAHTLILDRYLAHTGKTNWIHFTNIGEWTPHQDLDRSAIAEFIQYGNNIDAAAYYHAFSDGTGAALDGTDPAGYVLKIPKKEIPQAERFWSFTAYTPESIELVKNRAQKYEIASYTPGLTYDSDGGVTLYLAREQPAGVPAANWLPVPKGHFNIMLRVYGPEGSVADNSYVPPAIAKQTSN
ncbi:MAG TPA: DUF1214 domain-containing protein [Rhizomicrobium sp.]|nr:DUF1214 domain-containing protein [Rhizomicrobium sp.]